MKDDNSLTKKIEAILFYKAEPVSLKKLSNILEEKESATKEAVEELRNKLEERGITLIENNEEYTLATSKDVSHLIEKIRKDELNRDLGKAGIETLAVIVYEGPISRSEIDYIRGVNSQFIVRNLLMRGLIEKIENEKDNRSVLYKPSLELVSYLGLSKIEDISGYEDIRKKIEQIKSEETDNNLESKQE